MVIREHLKATRSDNTAGFDAPRARLAKNSAAYNFSFLEPQGEVCIGKSYRLNDNGDWIKTKTKADVSFWRSSFVRAESLAQMFKAFQRMESKHGIAIMAHRNANPDVTIYDSGNEGAHKGYTRKLTRARTLKDGTILKPTFMSVPLFFVFLDLDNFECSGTPAEKVEQIIAAMPSEFQSAGCVWQVSASHAAYPHLSKMHLIFFFDIPLYPHAARAFASESGLEFDEAMDTTAQPYFTERPRFVGGRDPIAVRVGIREGAERVHVPDRIRAINTPQKESGAAKRPANPSMPANSARGFDHFVDVTTQRKAPKPGNRSTTVQLIAKDVCQAALDFDVGEALAFAYLSPSDETLAAAEEAMKECGYSKAAEAALALRRAGEAIADAWEDRDPEKDWNAHAEKAYGAAPWGNFAGETWKPDDGAEFGLPDLNLPPPNNGDCVVDTVNSDRSGDADNADSDPPVSDRPKSDPPADVRPLGRVVNLLRQTILLGRPFTEIAADAQRVLQAALAAGDTDAIDLANAVLADGGMGEDVSVYDGRLEATRERLVPSSKALGADLNGLARRLDALAKQPKPNKARFEAEALELRRLGKEAKLPEVARSAGEAIVIMRSGLTTDRDKSQLKDTLNRLDVLTLGATATPTAGKGKAHTKRIANHALATADDRNNREDLIEDLMRRNTVGMTFAEPGAKKTFMLLDLAAHVATGTAVDFGDRVRAVEKAPVLYYALEGGDSFDDRVHALTLKHPDLIDNPFFNYVVGDVSLIDGGEKDIIATAEEIRQETGFYPALIVIDTLADATVGFDENSAGEMGVVVVKMKEVRDATLAHVHCVHHSGKDVTKGARGSTRMKGSLDTEVSLEKGDGFETYVTIKKQRDLPTDPFVFTTRRAKVRTTSKGKDVYSLVVAAYALGHKPKKGESLTAMQGAVWEAVKGLCYAGSPAAVKAIGDKADLNRDQVNRTLRALRKRGLIVPSSNGGWTLPPPRPRRPTRIGARRKLTPRRR